MRSTVAPEDSFDRPDDRSEMAECFPGGKKYIKVEKKEKKEESKLFRQIAS